MQHEVRSAGAPDLGVEEDVVRVSGYAAVFDRPAEIGSSFQERIARGAFARAIGRDDVVFVINHGGEPLARTRAGNLTLTEDDHGLKVDAVLDPADPDVTRLVAKLRAKNLDKMSFAFRAVRQEWDDTVTPPLRTIQEVELFDVSVVNSPAYDGTDIGLRGLDAHRRAKNHSAASARIRMKKNLAARL